MNTLSEQFINFTISNQILKFGEFKTKAGRISPYFFNMGLINNGKDLKELGQFYLELINKNNITFDLLFGPAYKGISIVSATAIAFGDANIKFAFNRKEVKDHGEGGQIIGHPIQGDVVIIDDVISAGTAIRAALPRHPTASPCRRSPARWQARSYRPGPSSPPRSCGRQARPPACRGTAPAADHNIPDRRSRTCATSPDQSPAASSG